MEYLHILPVKTGEITEFLSMMEENFDLSEHKFLTLITREGIIKGCPELLAFPFVENFETSKGRVKRLHNYLMLKQRLKQADVIIWHSLSMDKGRFAKVLFFNPDLCEKSVWIENGADALNWTIYKGKLKNKISETLQKTIRNRITRIGTGFRGNEEFIKNIWPNKQVIFTPYPINEEIPQMLEAMDPESRRKKYDNHLMWLTGEEKENPLPRRLRINIQIGQNSQSLNRHVKLINSMSRYRDCMINVFLPFNYRLEKNAMNVGTKPYQTNIRNLAISRFQKKCYILMGSVDKETFFRYLRSIDIILLGSENAFEITYLLLAIASGAKLFLDQDSSLYRYLESSGMRIHKIQDISEMEYEDFIALEEPQPLPREIAQHFDREYVIECWKAFFESIRTE